MKLKVLFLTNLPSPYRVEFFNELSKYVDLTVLYQRKSSSERDKNWKNVALNTYNVVFLPGIQIGVDSAFCPCVIKYLKKNKFDKIVICGVNSPTSILAIFWCKLLSIKYYIEIDGGFAKSGKGIRERLKHLVISNAYGYFSTSVSGDDYLVTYGADREKIYRYPFTSISKKDLVDNMPSFEEKNFHRKNLGIEESKIVLSVGRFTYNAGYGKGYDLLLKIAEHLTDIGFYIIGDNPTPEFLEIKKNKNLNNVHYIGFKTKSELSCYYRASDIFVLLSRGDVWGLVINEAMSNGLPVISTDKVIAALEMITDGYNGYIVPVNNSEIPAKRILDLFSDNSLRLSMSNNAVKVASEYTIEKSCESHLSIFNGGGYKHYLRFKNNILQNKFIILYVGQFIYRKGLDIILNVAHFFSDNCAFFIVGGIPTNEYKEFIKMHGLNNIFFYNFQSKDLLSDFYYMADLFFFPTREDVWGLVINEAMAHGLPVISSDMSGACLEMVKDGYNGYIVKSEDIDSMVNAINRIISDPVLREKMSYNSYMTACKFTIEEMVNVHIKSFYMP